MGWNSTVIVLHDALHAIAEDQAFGKKLQFACARSMPRERADISSMNHTNAASVIVTDHADVHRVVITGGNTGLVTEACGHYRAYVDPDALKLEMLKKYAESLGYVLRKKTS